MTPQTPQGAALSDADIDQLVKDIHDAIAELAGVARYPDLTEAIERLASCAAADRRLTAEQPAAVWIDPADFDELNTPENRGLAHNWTLSTEKVGRLTKPLFAALTAEQGGADFETWWEKHGQFSRAGGGDYEKTFAYNAWRAALTTQPQAEPRKDGSISFEEAQDLARRHAKAEPESYYSEPFEPHLWVINAIVEASATWYERAVQERVRRVKAESTTAQPQAEPAAAPLPKIPPPGLLMSMALRFDHGLGCPGFYDQPFYVQAHGATHAQRLESTLRQMRQLYEEVGGHGFYNPELEAKYAALATPSPTEPT